MRDEGAQRSDRAGVEQTLVDADVSVPLPGKIEGRQLGRYIVGTTLGAGAMGVVYSAFDPELDRRVALKLLHPRLAGGTDAEAARLLREARAMARLSHPNVITVHDVGTHEGRIFLAMDYVDGTTLTGWLAARRSVADVIATLTKAGAGLAAAHDRGLVHGDFKPDNVMIGEDGRVIVTDFGLARVDNDDEVEDASTREAPADATGLVGTPAYMAPEQFMGVAADPRCDQFAFCVALHEALYGVRPFQGTTPGALFVAMAETELVEPPADRNVPRWLRRAVLKGLSREPSQRHPDMHALLDVLASGGVLRRKVWLFGLAGAAAVLLVIGARGPAARPCEDAATHLEGVWDPARIEAISHSLTATRSSQAGETLQRVTERLDRYASEWVRMRQDNCLATAVRRVQSEAVADLRNVCLDRRLRSMEHVVSMLEHADEGVVRNAVEAVAGLPSIGSCGDVDALTSRLPAPRDPQSVAEIRDRLDQVDALQTAGRFDDAVALAAELEERVAAVDYAPLTAEVSLSRGRALLEAGQLDTAEAALMAAYFAALQVQHDAVAAAAAAELAYVVGYPLARHDEGLKWGEHALAYASRAGDGGLVEAQAHHSLGVVAEAIGETDTAARHHTRAHELRVALLDPDHPEIVRSLNALARIHHQRAEYDEALDDFGAALELGERIFGPDHLEVASVLNNMSLVLKRQHEFQSAAAMLRRAIAIEIAIYGEEHPDVAQAKNNLGQALRRGGDPTAAIVEHRDALRIREATQGAEHPDVGDPLVALGCALSDLGRHAEAEAAHLRALNLYERGFGPSHPIVGTALLGLSVAKLGLGHRDDAERILQRALPLLARTPAALEYAEAIALSESLALR